MMLAIGRREHRTWARPTSRSAFPGHGVTLSSGCGQTVRVTRALRQALSWISWLLAVVAGVLTGAAFAGGGLGCATGHRTTCAPQTWVLVVGVVLTIGLGVAGAVLWKPRPRRPEPRFPWEYRQ